jgi:protein-tyrosine phosphatase
MASNIFWIDGVTPGRLAILARPRANDWLDDDVMHWKTEGIGSVICLLEREEIQDLGLQLEKPRCEAAAIEFIFYPIPDRGVPASFQQTRSLAETIVAKLKVGGKVGIHCRAGIGRSALIAASVLSVLGYQPDEAFNLTGKARGVRVPDTDEQRDWLVSFAAGSR